MSSPLIDTHMHLWNRNDPQLTYQWLDPASPHPILTPEEVGRIAKPLYSAADYAAECAPAGVAAAVHVQAAVGIQDPVKETSWLEEQRLQTGWPHRIVGYADLASDGVVSVLDDHLVASPAFVGVRDFGSGGEYLLDDAWHRGLDELGRRNLVCCLDVAVPRMDLALSAARRHEDVTFVLDHMGLPLDRGEDALRAWVTAASRLASARNVYCKVSEHTMVIHGWDPANAKRWIHACIDVFGPDRCFFGSNWPVDGLYVSFAELADAYRNAIDGFSESEQHELLWGSAERVFLTRGQL